MCVLRKTKQRTLSRTLFTSQNAYAWICVSLAVIYMSVCVYVCVRTRFYYILSVHVHMTDRRILLQYVTPPPNLLHPPVGFFVHYISVRPSVLAKSFTVQHTPCERNWCWSPTSSAIWISVANKLWRDVFRFASVKVLFLWCDNNMQTELARRQLTASATQR